MATYNMPALSSGTNPNDALGLNQVAMGNGGGPAVGQGLGIDGFDQDMNFDESIL